MLNDAPTPRTGMSDAHLRPDLQAQNPLYQRAGRITGRFETERCPYHARAMDSAGLSEAERRREAMARREKHLVLPPEFALGPVRWRSSYGPKPQPVLRPSLSLGATSDRKAHAQALRQEHWKARRRAERSQPDRSQGPLRSAEAAFSAARNANRQALQPPEPDLGVHKRAFWEQRRRQTRPREHIRHDDDPSKKERTMSETPPGRSQGERENKGRAPDIDLRDGALRSATWLTKGDYELLSNTAYTRSYVDQDGAYRETSRMRAQDHAPLMELIRETRTAIVERNRAYKHELHQDRESGHDPEGAEDGREDTPSHGDEARERFAHERTSQRNPRQTRTKIRSTRRDR